MFPGSLQTEQRFSSSRKTQENEALEKLEKEMNLNHSKGYYKTVGSKYLVGSSLPPYCNSRYLTHLVVVDARTQHRLIDQVLSVPKCVRLSGMSKKSHDLLTKIFREIPERSRDELEEIMGEKFVKFGDGNVSDSQKKKASGMMAN